MQVIAADGEQKAARALKVKIIYQISITKLNLFLAPMLIFDTGLNFIF